MLYIRYYRVALLFTLTVSSTILRAGKSGTDSLPANNKQIPLLYGDHSADRNIYSVSAVFSNELEQTTSFSLFDSFNGRLSGYNSLNSLIWGYSSVNQGPMLVLLDNFEQSMDIIDRIDVREIESVSVLKDAASTALYGQRAANGILLIKTKRGINGKATVKIEGTTGLYTMTEQPKYYDSYDYMGFYNEALQNDGLPIRYTEETRELYRASGSELYPNTFWYNEVLNSFAPLSKVGLTIRGGNENIKYFVLANFSNRKELFKQVESDESPTHNQNRINFRTNFDIKLFESTNIKVDIGGYLNDENRSIYTNSEIFGVLRKNPPYIMEQYADGVYGGDATYTNNPLAMLNGSGYTQNHHRYYTANFELIQNLDKAVKGLSFHGKVNITNWSLYSDTWKKNYATQHRTDTVITNGFNDALAYTSATTQIRHIGADLFFDYTRKWADSELSGLLGGRISQEIQSGQSNTYSHLDFFGKVSYQNRDKYFADFVAAYNGSQYFAPGKRFGFFPAAAAGWLISGEDWFSSNVVKSLKLRASAGLTGSDYVENSPVDYRFMYLQRYRWHTGYNLGNDYGNQGGVVQAMPAYVNAKWENSFKTNVGLDLGITKNLNLSFDAFIDDRSDILVSRDGTIPALIGIELPLVNQGRVVSKGIEVSADYLFTIMGDFKFNLNGYFNYNKSRILNMNEIPQAYDYLNRTGGSVGQFFGLESIGFFHDQDDIDNSPRQLFSEVRPGDIKYKDQNGDKVIDEFDVVAIGRSNVPEILYAFSPSIEHKGFRITALFEGVANRTVYQSTTQFWAFSGQSNIASNAVEGRWTVENPNGATLPRLTTLDNKNNYRLNDIWLKNGAFLKLRNVELSYDFPKQWISLLSISQFTVYVRGNNLFTLDHIKNADADNMGILPAYSLKNIGFKLIF